MLVEEEVKAYILYLKSLIPKLVEYKEVITNEVTLVA